MSRKSLFAAKTQIVPLQSNSVASAWLCRSTFRWGKSPSPLSVALQELSDYLRKYDLLRRLHIAHTDMELAAHAARELVPSGHDVAGSPAPPLTQLSTLSEVIEAGIVTIYTRNYTGRAALPEKWRPEKWRPLSEGDRKLHVRLMDLRNALVVHADWSSERTLVNTTTMLGMQGPPIIAEVRASLSRNDLQAIGDMCERQAARFNEATWYLKREFSIPVAGTGN